MAKIQKTKEDDFRKKLIKSARRKYLEGQGKSITWQEVKAMAVKDQRTTKKVDQEIALYLPFLNIRQKQIILSLVKAIASKQDQFWRQIHKDQRRALKNSTASRDTTVTSTKVR